MNCLILTGTVIIYLILLCILWPVPDDCVVWKKTLTIVSMAFAGATTIFVHLYWRNTVVSIIAGIFAICLFMVSIGAMTPEEAGHHINNGIDRVGKDI